MERHLNLQTGMILWVHIISKNGQEYVGDPNAQHMTIEMSEYVREHGMGD